MTTIKTRANNFIMAAAAVAAIGAALVVPGMAKAGNTDGPWPEPPSCSNETGTCTSIADQLAYECFFEDPEAPITWCDDPVELLVKDTKGLVAADADDSKPAPTKIGLPAARR